ncbi:YifB family Mg chelatase-like AAA ATPase [Candidatus Nesciobacter abundans]|uniref:YifB family Mg chelatase-like AAA ATPase n=1 Tax=Candidatus Nesciobacter abundans TaxID=2601668 RepID=UPI00248291E2|nr:YifB family Mg chelatase-like AAA ATPase [Candidatus Nesciobacter abundans]
MKAHTVSFQGVDAVNIEVQIHISRGLPAFNIVGLPDKTIGESKERIRAALQSIGFALPAKRIIINMSPADIPKEGNHYDLPITIGIMAALEIIPEHVCSNWIIMGELGLDGSIINVKGSIIASLHAKSNNKGIICPAECGPECKFATDIPVIAAGHLIQIINHFNGTQVCKEPEKMQILETENSLDFKDVKGHESIKRALEIAAAGRHHALLIGSPGAGKSMLSSRISTILPDMEISEAIEVYKIYSMSNISNQSFSLKNRPFRSPHHNSSLSAMVGGGYKCKPGEISLAHNGVLFMDELSLWKSDVLNGIREALESGKINISRANSKIEYPSSFHLIAAMNPCSCGNAYDIKNICSKFPKCHQDYISKIPGPIWDRFGIIISVPKLAPWELSSSKSKSKSSFEMKESIKKAIDFQKSRYKDCKFKFNHDINSSEIKMLNITESAIDCLNIISEKRGVSSRRYYNTLKIARTIADLDQSESVETLHMKESISYCLVNQVVNIK